MPTFLTTCGSHISTCLFLSADVFFYLSLCISNSYATIFINTNLSPLYSLHALFSFSLIFKSNTEVLIGVFSWRNLVMSKARDMEIKLFGRTITSLFAVNHYDPSSSLSPVHGVSDQSKEASSSSSSSSSPSTGPDRVCHVNPNLVSSSVMYS